MKTKLKMLSLSVSLLACGLAASGNANAVAYGSSTFSLQNGFIGIGVDTDGDGIPDDFSNSAISFVPGSINAVSSSAATLNGIGQAGSSAATNPNAPVSNGTGAIPLRANEDVTGAYYNLFGPLGTAFSAGDANTPAEQTALGTPSEARSIAESNIPVSGFADASGRNASSTAVNAVIDVGNDCAAVDCGISFSFQADPYLRALLDLAAAPGSVARSTLAVSITLTPVGGLVPIFAWAPNGAAGGIVGGTEVDDDENLNLTREALLAGQDEVFSGPYASGVFGNYFAYTDFLAVGQYTLSLQGTTQTDVSRIAEVPEPGSLLLAGIGLLGLGAMRRRKQA